MTDTQQQIWQVTLRNDGYVFDQRHFATATDAYAWADHMDSYGYWAIVKQLTCIREAPIMGVPGAPVL